MLFAALAPFFLATAFGTAMTVTGPPKLRPNSPHDPSSLDDADLDNSKKLSATFGELTTKQILDKGLDLLGVRHPDRIRMTTPKQVTIFTNNYGPHPFHVARVWSDLLNIDPLDAAHVPPAKACFGHFLICLNWLRKYKTEDGMALDFKCNEKTVRCWNWYFVDKIEALKEKKIVWPDEWKTIFIISVDGTHFRIEEPCDPELRKNKAWYSRKTGGPTINAEIAIHLWEDKVVHVYCSGAAGRKNDLSVYREKLKAMIPAGKRVIVDKGYNDKKDPNFSWSSAMDNEAVRDFKNRCRSRHEKFNGELKNYMCLKHPFRHTDLKFARCFHAVVVLCQYEMDEDAPQKYRKCLIDN